MNKQFVMLIGIMLLFSFAFVTSAGLEQVGDLKDVVTVDIVKPNYCYNSDFKIVECSGLIKSGETKIKEEEKLLIKTDAVYLIGIDKKEIKLEDKKDSSIYIHKKVGTTYHVDNLNDIPVETYLDFYYTKQPNVITHVNKYGEKVKDFQVWEYQWTPKTCEGSGEDMVCSKDGTARIFTTLTENSVGSETFPLTFTPAQWKTDNQGYASFDGVDDYVNTIINVNNTLKNQQFSISLWFNAKSFTDGGFLYSASSSGATRFYLRTSSTTSGHLSLGLSNVNPSLLSVYNLNQWINIIINYNETNSSVYSNGQLIYSNSSTVPNFPNDIMILGKGGITFFNGSLDNVQIFNKSLNSTEIASLYNYGRQTKGICNLITDGQVACYDFDDNSFGDGSGNGNYGTPMGFSDTTPEVNDVTQLSSGDYSLTPSGALTIDDEKYLYRYLNAEWEYDRVRVSWLTFLLPLLAAALAFITFKLAIEDNK